MRHLAFFALLTGCTADLEEQLSALQSRVSDLEDELETSEADQAAADEDLQEALDALADELATLEDEVGEDSGVADSGGMRFLHECEGTGDYEVDPGFVFDENNLSDMTLWYYADPVYYDWAERNGASTPGKDWYRWQPPDVDEEGRVQISCNWQDFSDYPEPFEGYQDQKALLIVDD